MWETPNQIAAKKAKKIISDAGLNPDDIPFKDMSFNECISFLYLEILEIKKKLDMK